MTRYTPSARKVLRHTVAVHSIHTGELVCEGYWHLNYPIDEVHVEDWYKQNHIQMKRNKFYSNYSVSIGDEILWLH